MAISEIYPGLMIPLTLQSLSFFTVVAIVDDVDVIVVVVDNARQR